MIITNGILILIISIIIIWKIIRSKSTYYIGKPMSSYQPSLTKWHENNKKN